MTPWHYFEKMCVIERFPQPNQEPVGLAFAPATQLAKTTLFCPGRAASGNEADVRQTRRSAFGRPKVDPQGAVQGWVGTQTRRSAIGRPEVDPTGAVQG